MKLWLLIAGAGKKSWNVTNQMVIRAETIERAMAIAERNAYENDTPFSVSATICELHVDGEEGVIAHDGEGA